MMHDPLSTMDDNEVYLGRGAGPPGLRRIASGKVRDIYEIDAERLLFVTSDRVSAFDVVMDEGIPHKGRVLTAISTHWFEHTRDLIENHLLGTSVAELPPLDPDPRRDQEWRRRFAGRVMIVRRCAPTSVEWVVRGYLVGSGWKEYQRTQSICGVALPAGLRLADKLPEPILTPTTKDADHDRPITADQARERVGSEIFERARAASLALFARGTAELAELGILLADTKFEFGLCDGRLLLIDEVLTPDSSRFWSADEWRAGENPPSYDKQILRDHLETLDWNKEPPPPALPAAVLARVGRRYVEVCERITGAAPTGVA